MKTVTGDLWSYGSEHPNPWICITTNGSRNSRGHNIMGSGCAKELKERHPGFPAALGVKLAESGNQLYIFESVRIITFPTKHEWNRDSDLALIINSSRQLAKIANENPDALYILPRPGVGAGKLSWEKVLPAIENILPDNVHTITWN